uniref:Adenosine kinase n=1 Tax=Phaeomonas parva TaxID=124430 RepID=A0A7S1UH54_9STRA
MARLVAFGNPMQDVTFGVDAAFYERFGLKGGIELRRGIEAHRKILAAAHEGREAQYGAGGSALNSAKAFVWSLRKVGTSEDEELTGAATMVGAIGDDAEGQRLEDGCRACGIVPELQQVTGVNTGVCVVLVGDEDAGKDRCLFSIQGAYKLYDPKPLQAALEEAARPKADPSSSPGLAEQLREARILYATAFTLTNDNRAEAVASFFAFGNPDRIPEQGTPVSESKRRTVALNLSSAGLYGGGMSVMHRLLPLLPLVDVLFGNEEEMRSFAAELLGRDVRPELQEILGGVAEHLRAGATLVVTRGAEATAVARVGNDAGSECEARLRTIQVRVPPLEAPLVNTNGAGDAFVGGFLAGLGLGLELESCCAMGHNAAAKVLLQADAGIL